MKFRKKPVIIEAEQYDKFTSNWSPFLLQAICTKAHQFQMGDPHIHTLEGKMEVMHLDWIIKGVKGEFYPCKPDIFEATYEKVN